MPLLRGERPRRHNVCTVIVTYHPDNGFPERAARIAAQCESLVIVDNGSHGSTLTMLRATCSRLSGHLIANDRNLGIAAALNQGLRFAQDGQFVWALTLDQDSLVDERMVEKLAAAYDFWSGKERLAIVGSNYWDINPKAQPVKCSSGCRSLAVERNYVITSGTLLRLDAYRAIGPIRDELFIDLVDMEYCFRARAAGFDVIITTEVLMKHPVGVDTIRRLVWKEIHPTNHPAWRRYYMVRNYILLVRQYLLQEPRWALLHLYSIIVSTITICLFEEEKLKKTRYAAVGLKDGLLANLQRSPLPDTLAARKAGSR